MRDRIRAALATITSAPWRRAPGLLRHRPGVLATLAGACVVTAASVAAVPLFLSSAGTESVALQAAERCPRDTGVTQEQSLTPASVRTPSADPFAPLAGRLGPSNSWARLELVSLGGAGASSTIPASLLARDEVLEHVDVVEGSRGDGLWISDRAAEGTGLEVGDPATIGRVTLPVAGIYRDVAGNSVDDFWCSNADMVLVQVRGADLVLPPPVMLADRATFAEIMSGLEVARAEGAWEAPLGSDLTVADTEALTHTLACSTEEALDLGWCQQGSQPLVARANAGFRRDPVAAQDDADFVRRYFHSSLPFVTERSEAIQTSVGGGIWPVAGFSALAGVGLVAAAASLWFDRRRREITLLSVRGVSPSGLGLKAVLELLVPSVVGTAGGVALAYGVVVWLGPSPVLEPAALGRAALGGLLALAVASLTIAVVVARRARRHEVRRSRRTVLAYFPWEVLLGWLTVVSFQRLGDWGIPVGRGAEVTRVDVLGLLFPVLFLVTAVAVLSRILSFGVRPLRSISRSWATALYLGIRRVARYRIAVLGLVAAAAVAAGVLGYAATMNRSLDATLQAKGRTFVGSDLAVRIPADESLPAELADRATELQVHGRAWVDDGQRLGVTVFGVDPDTFEQAAFWDSSFADQSLEEILAALTEARADGEIPAVLVGAEVDGAVEAGIVETGTTRFMVDPIEGVRSFPGMKRAKPTMFVSSEALDALDLGGGRREAWVRGDHDETLQALEAAGTGFDEERRFIEVAGSSSFVTVSWTFGFMQFLGFAAGVLVVGGVGVYLDARRRDRLLGYAFMRRMGLRREQHRRALLVELTASVLVGCWTGLAIALVAAWLAYGQIDPVPSFDPQPLLRPAGPVIVALVVASVAITVGAGFLAQRRIDRDDPVEVLRAGV